VYPWKSVSKPVQVILRALKKYGMMLADNGSAWYISGAPDPSWDDDMLVTELRLVKGSDFEAVDVSSLMVDVDSGQTNSIDVFVDGFEWGDTSAWSSQMP